MDPLAIVDKAWPLARHLANLHAFAYRLTGGLIGHRSPVPTLLLEHTGAKSGVRRQSPLAYFRDGDDLVVLASKGGYPQHPAWYHNLRANPETTVRVKGRTIPVRARTANPGERRRLWPDAVRHNRSFELYQRRTDREIPVIILEPV
ncbi:nitroreductase family deazaflavin-dependent oxidoreductase [Sciscionella sediminilitoris]|uniref:nitroreductase family deazaflavin-dependent oxidoreductase n=1 Tax=Sciscionella sediminilitoris TaxID=1445613 RepID=UPI0004DF1BD7|nr:nitroreductase family deazaflavin-dependent oxidoreductase [Sciscionella sp. SE31]